MKRDTSLARLFLLTALLVAAFIYSTELIRREVSIDIFDYAVLTGVFVYPITFYIANLITHSFTSRDTIRAVLLAVIIQFVFLWLAGNMSALPLMFAISGAFVIAQATNLYVVEDLIRRATNKYSDWFMLYVLVLLLDNIIYITIMSNYSSIAILSASLLLAVIVKCIVAAVLGLGEVLVIMKK